MYEPIDFLKSKLGEVWNMYGPIDFLKLALDLAFKMCLLKSFNKTEYGNCKQ